ncbi:hypothetical protein SAZ11_21160 [Streptomyces sp. FXJ1.4098]|uniref:hypothetical protein n=1 Tax=Streptomyces sp. NPDC020845 TaxID=3365096 RepID=UPI0029913C6D|nr:hypothetical protein [Streptomyces sp. FXJ1.4098]
MTISSVWPSQRTTDVSRATATVVFRPGTSPPQPQAYAGHTSDPSWIDTSASTTSQVRCHPGRDIRPPTYRTPHSPARGSGSAVPRITVIFTVPVPA